MHVVESNIGIDIDCCCWSNKYSMRELSQVGSIDGGEEDSLDSQHCSRRVRRVFQV